MLAQDAVNGSPVLVDLDLLTTVQEIAHELLTSLAGDLPLGDEVKVAVGVSCVSGTREQ